ncbi:class I lanthipeptide [Flavobacterium amniphilum]|uniref:class I lanthipeptide n=1 Tax=Flavobacterium amniphilum TaxID=1834035 RepID=UPI00202A1F6F|nr:class I lanthipeptide [Flavobacterium amniphilum]MCL9807392.1 class I lanthipeptide [Flavobacterium amniphilum]
MKNQSANTKLLFEKTAIVELNDDQLMAFHGAGLGDAIQSAVASFVQNMPAGTNAAIVSAAVNFAQTLQLP